MSKSNAGNIALVAVAGLGAYLLYGKFGGIGKGIKETVENVTETAKTVYDNPVSDSARTILDDMGIIDKEDPISTIVTYKPLATNPLQAFTGIANLFATGIKNATDTAGKAISDGFDTIVVENVKTLGTTISGNPVNSIVNFFSGLLNQNKETNTDIKDRESMTSNTVLKNGQLVEKDAKTKMIEKVSGIEVKEIIGAPSTLTKEERENLPVVPVEKLAERNDFTGRVAKLAVKVKQGGYTGNILENLK